MDPETLEKIIGVGTLVVYAGLGLEALRQLEWLGIDKVVKNVYHLSYNLSHNSYDHLCSNYTFGEVCSRKITPE